MPYKIKMFKKRLVIYIKRIGRISQKERMLMFQELLDLPLEQKVYCFILDNREADLSDIKKDQNFAAIDLIKAIEKKIGHPTKCVVLVKRKMEFAIARQLEMYISDDEDFGSEIRVYYRKDAAIKFLQGDDCCIVPEDLL